MNLIVAVDNNWAIGNKGDLLARVRGDLKNFSSITTGKVVILGSNTLATFPDGKILKNRTNIVLSSRLDYNPEGALMARSLDDLFTIISKYDSSDVYVIGGASIYKQLLPYCDTAFVTKFEKTYESDASIPDLDKDPLWKLVYRSAEKISNPETDTEADLHYFFTKYRKV